jgi:orotate phosphoribosyltransferase
MDGRRGHFRLESGHHGELWLDLDELFRRPAQLGRSTDELAGRLAASAAVEAVCGPLVGGALVAFAVAATLDVELFVAEPGQAAGDGTGLYGARYRIPGGARDRLAGRKVAVVDDVINAGSATRATIADLRAAGATVVAIGALVVLGSPAGELAAREGLPLERVASLPNRLWEPSSCPLCASGVPLEDPAGTVPPKETA